MNLMANPFTKEGKEFAGWATSSDGNVRYGDQAQVQSLTAEAGGTVTLYAVWRTPISEIQKPYLDRLDAAFQDYTQGDYTTQDWGTLSGAYTAAVNQIQGTESTVTMDRAVSNAQTAMAAVPVEVAPAVVPAAAAPEGEQGRPRIPQRTPGLL